MKKQLLGIERDVSIHAPRVGRDAHRFRQTHAHPRFQFTRPAWGATLPPMSPTPLAMFQFTRPAWGATARGTRKTRTMLSFNSRAPRGARRSATCPGVRAESVSIHAPRVGRDYPAGPDGRWWCKFQFTRPAWGRDDRGGSTRRAGCVSIHAPRVGRDHGRVARPQSYRVSIHAPRVGRDFRRLAMASVFECFNSRAPRGARPRQTQPPPTCSVSIHAPRVGRDATARMVRARRIRFNSRAPRGARPPRSRRARRR